MATLSDYFDLNRRYFNITDTIIFENRIIKLDIIPKYSLKKLLMFYIERPLVEVMILDLISHWKIYRKHLS